MKADTIEVMKHIQWVKLDKQKDYMQNLHVKGIVTYDVEVRRGLRRRERLHFIASTKAWGDTPPWRHEESPRRDMEDGLKVKQLYVAISIYRRGSLSS